jgi:hypothetical protein
MGFVVPVLVTTGTSELSRTERIKVRVKPYVQQIPLTLISPSGRIPQDESRKGREDFTFLLPYLILKVHLKGEIERD